MASQQPRPAWFRLSAIANRPAAPAPTPDPAPPPPPVAQLAPIRPPAPVPAILRPTIPSIPIRPSLAPTQTQEPAPPPPPAVASLPSTAASPPSTAAPPPAVASPPSTPAPPSAAPPRSPVATPAQTATASRSPTKASTLTAAPPSSPTAQVAAPPRSPVVSPAPQLSPRVPAAAPPSQSPPPPPTSTAPQPTSPVPKAPLTNSTNGTAAFSSITASPKTKTKSPSSSMPTSPVPRPMASAAGLTATGNLNSITPNSSPKIVKPLEKTPAQSPKFKPLSNPPSPFTLPPVQKTEDESEPQIPAEVEQKTVLVQETIEKPMKMPNKHNASASNEKRDTAMKVRGNGKKNSDSEGLGMRVITLAGENKGAVMELSPSQKKKYPVGKPQSLQKNKHSDQSSSESGEEGKSNQKDKTYRATAMQSPPMTAFLNSNVQGVNNSILYNCHCRHNDPGVHLSLNRKTNGKHSKDHNG